MLRGAALMSFLYRKQALESQYSVVKIHSTSVYGENGFFSNFKRSELQKYAALKTEIDKFVADYQTKFDFVTRELCRFKESNDVTSDDEKVLTLVEKEMNWLRLALYGDDNFSKDFRSLGLLNYFGGCQREEPPLLSKLFIWSKHLTVGKTLN